MGNWSFSEFSTFLKFQFGQNEDLENVDGTNFYEEWINAAYRDITERHKFWDVKKRFYFPELETSTTKTTTDGTAYVTKPTDALFIQEIFDETNEKHLKFIPWRQYVDKTDRSDTDNESNPTKWTTRDSYIYLYPTPDTDDESLTVYYRQRITELSDSSDTTDLGEEWDEPILVLAAIKGNMWMNDWGKVEKLKEEWKDMVKDRLEIYTPEELARKEWVRIHPSYLQR